MRPSGPQTIVGGTVSTIVIRCTQLASLRQSSVAVHVRSITYAPGHAPATILSP